MDFQIILAEIISKGLHKEIIRKMALAGFQHVQIGYESPSDTLLKKINKKNTFSSNLLFLKFANEYNISVTGANVLRNLLEETNEDVIEAINNLYYLRFFLIQGWFQHNISTLGVNSSSKYFKNIQNDLGAWRRNLMTLMLPKDYLREENSHHIIEFIKNTYNNLWNQFESIETYFLKNQFEYKIFKKKDKLIYREFCNYEQINELEINYNSQEYYILKNVNDSVMSIDSIIDLSQKEDVSFNVKELKIAIKELKNEGLIFHSSDMTEIISLINLDRTFH